MFSDFEEHGTCYTILKKNGIKNTYVVVVPSYPSLTSCLTHAFIWRKNKVWTPTMQFSDFEENCTCYKLQKKKLSVILIVGIIGLLVEMEHS